MSFRVLPHCPVSGQAGLGSGKQPLASCPAKAPHLGFRPHGGMATPKFHRAFDRTSPALPGHVFSATPASHSRYTWVSPVHDRQRCFASPRLLSCGATRLDPRFFPTGAPIAAAGSSAPLERTRARRGLGLGVSPSSAPLARCVAARRKGYPPGGVRPVRPASEGCKSLVHRGLMDSIQFSMNTVERIPTEMRSSTSKQVKSPQYYEVVV